MTDTNLSATLNSADLSHAARRRTDALYLDFARRAGAPVELPADWNRLVDFQKASRIDALREIAERIERRAAFAARYGCEVKA